MALWGTSTSNESKPIWLTDAQKERCYATKDGWVYKHLNGTEEVLVAIRNLANRLGNQTVTEVKFATGSYVAGATKSIKLSFNEKVVVTGSPTVAITSDLLGVITPVTATYASTNADGTTLTFSFTVPAADSVLSFAAQSIVLNGGTIAGADLAVSAPVAEKAGTKTAVAA